MKIVCDACQAKYSISDDKVQGKVFKIRCKKCSNIIVVRGGANAAEAAPPPQQEKETHVYDYGYDGAGAPAGDESVWHVVINQDQVGPMTAGEVGQRFAAGEIDAETYIWREGFTDWLPLAQVDTFASLASGGGVAAHAPAQAHGGGGQDAVSAMFGGGSGSEDAGTMRSDPGDLFAAASASSHASGGDDDSGSGDLFGSRPAAGGQAAAAGNAKLRGERNENSVLFSLNNLAQLASDKPSPAVAMTSTPSGHATGQAGGEGSGLIDIRSMASAYLGSSGAATGGKATTASIGTIDDLPVFGGGGFSEPAVIVPHARPQANNKILYGMIGAVGLLAVAAVIMVVVLLGGSNKNNGGDGKSTVAANDKDKDSKDKDSKDKPTTAENSAPDNGSSAAKTTDTPSPNTNPDNSATKTDATGSNTATGSGGSAQQVAANDKTPKKTDPPKTPVKTDPPKTPAISKTDPKTPTTPPADKKPDDKKPAAGDCDEVSCLLGTASGPCCSKFKKGGNTAQTPTTPTKTPTTTPPAGGGDLPETLDRDMISNGVGAISGIAKACGNKSSAKGKVKIHVKVAPGGNITGVDVSETPDAALGNCVAAAMQRAHFAKTQKGGSFSYPFVF